MNLDGIFFEIDDYELTDKFVGSGSFSKVYVVKCLKDHCNYAAKIINVNSQQGFTGKDQDLFMRESIILHKLSHPSIVKFIGINFRSFSENGKFEPTIITEYLPKGSLKEILDKEKKSLADKNWSATKKYICLLGISSAMKYLHDKSIIHRDLKPENVLMDENYYPHICDFGLSRFFSNYSQNLSMTGQIGTPIYMAPELFMNEKGNYGPEVDVYSFSILMYEIVSQKVPYNELCGEVTALGLANKICQGYRPMLSNEIPEKMKKLISMCWDENPSKRPTFETIFNVISNDRNLLGEYIDDAEVDEYLKILENHRQMQKNEKVDMKSFRSLVALIDKKSVDEIDVNELTNEKFEQLYELTKRYISIINVVSIHFPIAYNDPKKILNAISELKKKIRPSYNETSDGIKLLREQLREQTKWCFYLNHILEQIKYTLIEGERKLEIEFDISEEDDYETFKFLYDRFKNFVDYCYIFYQQINDRGGFEVIDKGLKEKDDLKALIHSPEYRRAKKVNEIIKDYLGGSYNPNYLEEILKSYNDSEKDSLNTLSCSILDKFGKNITVDDLQLKMTNSQENKIIFADKILTMFAAFGNNDDILDYIYKLKSSIEQSNENQVLSDSIRHIHDSCSDDEEIIHNAADYYDILNLIKHSLKAKRMIDIPNLIEKIKSENELLKTKIEDLQQRIENNQCKVNDEKNCSLYNENISKDCSAKKQGIRKVFFVAFFINFFVMLFLLFGVIFE